MRNLHVPQQQNVSLPGTEDRERAVSSHLTRVGFITSAVLFIYGVLVAYWKGAPTLRLPNATQEYSQLMAFFAATALSIFTGLITFIYELRLKLDLYGTHLRSTLEQIDNVVDCRYIGLGTQSVGPIIERIKNAQAVRNTLIFFDVSERDVVFASYSKSQVKDLGRAIRKLLGNGGSWSDILSQDAVNSAHLNWLNLGEDGTDASELSPEYASNRPNESDHYVIRCLKESYPVLNFMILQYGDGDEEVIFGQGHHSEDPSGRVYLSRNRN